MRSIRPISSGPRRLLPVALCALGGHIALYHSVRPSSGGHAYFAWYEPLVIGLSVAALAAFGALLLAAVVGRGHLRRTVARLLTPVTERPVPGQVRAVRLALASIAFLVCQETLERTLEAGRTSPAAFPPSQLALVLLVVAALAALVTLLERSCSELAALVLAPLPLPRSRTAGSSFPLDRPLPARRRNPLGELRGLRAPPLCG